jgi:hypothetical protein
MMFSFSCIAMIVVGSHGGKEGESEIHAHSDI